jgi:hypothetical protein
MKNVWWIPVIGAALLGGCQPPQSPSDETFQFPPGSKVDPFGLPRVIEIKLPPPPPEEISRPSPPLKEEPATGPTKTQSPPKKQQAKPAPKPKS